MIKKVAGNYYTHCSNLNELEYELCGFDGTNQKLHYLQTFQKHIKSIIPDIHNANYVLKYNTKNDNITICEVLGWDTNQIMSKELHEPIIITTTKCVPISTGAHSFYWYIGKTKRPKKQQVYHNKWQFVSENYKGFDVEKAKERTKQWNAIPNIKALKCKIGYKDFWYELLNENNLSIYVD